MYFPFLRGKQFELIALRELAVSMGESGVIHPVIEPVKKSLSTLNLTVDQLVENEVPFTFILNPTVGDFSDIHQKLIEIANQQLSDYESVRIGLIIDMNSNLDQLDQLLGGLNNHYRYTLVHLGRFPDMDRLLSFVEDKEITHNLLDESTSVRRYRRIIESQTKVIFGDAFNSQPVNADYANTPDEFFTDEHNYYEEDGFVGFGDYATIGQDFMESGFAPYAVAIHLTYERENSQIWIRHFVSDSNEDYSDVPGTYREALEKLIQFIHERDLQTEACKEFKDHYNRGHYPGLGSVKKLSIKHHIELITSILTK